MNYPLQQLAIIGPALFIALMVAFPVIGVFGGWKRAAYWGGGNFVFYVIGLLVWRFTSGGIVNLVTPYLEKIVEGVDFSKIAVSIAAPIYFILILIVANLILLINYYAWFKRVAGLKKYKKVKKTDAQGHVTKVKVQVQKNKSVKYRVINYVAGGVGMTALMLPTTFGLTEAVMYTTTSVTTRKENKLSSNVYNILSGVNSKLSWFSYYTDDSAKDFDALFAGLAMQNKKISIILPGATEETEMTVIDAVSQTFEKGIGNIFDEVTKTGEGKDVAGSVEEFKQSWDTIVTSAGDEMSALFNSENATDVIQGLLEIPDSSGTTITKDQVTAFIQEDGDFKNAIKDYQGTFEQVTITPESYSNMVDAVMGMYGFETEGEQAVSEKEKAEFRQSLAEMMGLLFKQG